jgi:hypothetical protein
LVEAALFPKLNLAHPCLVPEGANA